MYAVVRVCVIFSLILMSGCSYDILSVPEKKIVKTNQVLNKNYSLNTTQYAYVGEPIIKLKSYQQKVYAANKLFLPSDLVVSWNVNSKKSEYKLQKELSLKIIGRIVYKDALYNIAEFAQDNKYSYLLILNPNDNSINTDAIFLRDLITYDNQVSTFNINFSDNNIILKNEEIYELGDLTVGYINFELIFSGITKDTINVMYREYSSEDMARVAFYQNLVYNRTDDVIRFKNIVLKVHDVTNSQIVYSVLQDGL
jgi:hypothetical protein